MNTRDNIPKNEPPINAEVLAEVLRRRHALAPDEPHFEAKKAIADLIKRHTPAKT